MYTVIRIYVNLINHNMILYFVLFCRMDMCTCMIQRGHRMAGKIMIDHQTKGHRIFKPTHVATGFSVVGCNNFGTRPNYHQISMN